MIVRIATEGQYDVGEDVVERLNELDNACVTAVEAGDEATFHQTYEAMLALVRAGAVLGDDELAESALILPPGDLTFAEAGVHFDGEGLIPD